MYTILYYYLGQYNYRCPSSWVKMYTILQLRRVHLVLIRDTSLFHKLKYTQALYLGQLKLFQLVGCPYSRCPCSVSL